MSAEPGSPMQYLDWIDASFKSLSCPSGMSIRGAPECSATGVQHNLQSHGLPRARNPLVVCFQRITSVYDGGLNGSTQHQLEVYLQGSERLKSFVNVESNGTLPWLGSD